MIPRRLLALAVSLAAIPAATAQTTFDFDSTPDRVWIGRDFWANRLQDWRVQGGRVECVESRRSMPMRTAHVLTRELGPGDGRAAAAITVTLGRLDPESDPGPHSAAGLLLGAGSPTGDHRRTAQVHHVPAEDGGVAVLVDAEGSVTIRHNDTPPGNTPMWAISMPIGPDNMPEAEDALRWVPEARPAPSDAYLLDVRVVREGQRSSIVATVSTPAGEVVSTAVAEVGAGDVTGCIALASTGGPEGSPAGHWFDDLEIDGELVAEHPDREFGPVWHTMYVRDRESVGLTAQLPPLTPLGAGPEGLPMAELWVDVEGWRRMASAAIDPDSWTATFSLENWNNDLETPYEVRFAEPTADGGSLPGARSGVFRARPGPDDEYVIATFTGNKTYTGGLKWNRFGLWFPQEDLVGHVTAQDPDFLFFSGDQIYEGDLTPVDARNDDILCLDYLYKWTKWCWAFGELTRDRPSVAIPDDHDVYHGNVWGAGGRRAVGKPGLRAQDAGGYKHSPRFVNAVHRTQTSHLPPSVISPTIGEGYTTYTTPISDGGVSFAVFADRMFKESPTIAAPEGEYVNGWPQAEGFEARAHEDDPATPLLGAEQEAFLREWAVDWSHDAWVKVALSQTPFVGAHTIPAAARSDGVVPGLAHMAPGEYPPDDIPSPDADTNGWPRPARDRAVEALRRGFAIHLSGDQHLATLLRYGLDDWGDAGVSFAAPAVANTWPRRWFPIEEPAWRDEGAPRYTGDYIDGFGNRLTMIAAANPVKSGVEPAGLYDRAPGYGIVRLDRATREITYECWPRWVDPTEEGAACYEGWPVTMRVGDGCGSRWAFAVPGIATPGVERYTVTVRRSGAADILYSVRVYDGFVARVPDEGPWDVVYTDLATGRGRVVEAVRAGDAVESDAFGEARE